MNQEKEETKTSEDFDKWDKTCAKVNELMDVIIHHIEKENKK